MIDFHSHILPGIDDGSKSIDMTKAMISMEQEQGVAAIVATPHFYASESSVSHFLAKRERALGKVEDQISDRPLIIPGAEVYYFPDMGRADLSGLCIGGQNSRWLLLEMPFAQWTDAVYKDVKDLIKRQKLKLIIAHIERYYRFQKDKKVWNAVFDLPVIAQFNAGCLLSFTRRGLALKFLKNGYPTLLGTDCHNITTRKPNLKEGRGLVAKKIGEDKLSEIDRLGEQILKELGFLSL